MILLVNDDGIHAPGLRQLYRELRSVTRQPVLAVAPTIQHSGQAHAITLDRGLTVTPVLDGDFFGFAIDGTPVDCLKLAIKVLAPEPPALVVSGINDGPNVGRSLFYSGTVGAAMEAAVEGFAAVAVSRDVDGGDFGPAATYAARLAKACLGRRELVGSVVNVNLPATLTDLDAPLAMVPHGRSGFEERYRPQRSRTGHLTWHLSGTRVELPDEGTTDAHLLAAGHPTLSLLKPNYNAPGDHLPERILRRLGAREITLTS